MTYTDRLLALLAPTSQGHMKSEEEGPTSKNNKIEDRLKHCYSTPETCQKKMDTPSEDTEKSAKSPQVCDECGDTNAVCYITMKEAPPLEDWFLCGRCYVETLRELKQNQAAAAAYAAKHEPRVKANV